MAPGTATETTATHAIGMGQLVVAAEPVRLTAILGSCVGVVLYHQRTRRAGLAHVVLPESSGNVANPGKFSDTAVLKMIEELGRYGATPPALTAKIAGGACMFGSGGPMQIGDANIKATIKILDEAGVRLVARDIGGNSGRRISLDCGTGEVTIQTVGKPPRDI